jgi:hypothetical protein
MDWLGAHRRGQIQRPAADVEPVAHGVEGPALAVTVAAIRQHEPRKGATA